MKKNVNLTERDIKVIKMLEKNVIMTTTQIAKMFYSEKCNEKSALNVAHKRLKLMSEIKQVKRHQDFVCTQNIYYLGKTPTKTQHRLLMVDFMIELKKQGFKILDVEVEWSDLQKNGYHLRPDMKLTVDYWGKKIIMLVEVDITKEFTNYDEYYRVVENRNQLKEYLPTAFMIVSVSDKEPKHDQAFKPQWISSDFANISKLGYLLNRK